MNKKMYEKTRYQNIYRNIKNKNYVVMINKPIKTSISSIDGKKILKIEDAVKIRDNPKIKLQKSAEIKCNGDFDELWEKYIYHCKYELKLAYNTILRKTKTYNKYLKHKIVKKISKLTKNEIAKFIDECECSNKQNYVNLHIILFMLSYLLC